MQWYEKSSWVKPWNKGTRLDTYFYQPELIPAFCSVKHLPKVTDCCHFRSVCRDLLVQRHLFHCLALHILKQQLCSNYVLFGFARMNQKSGLHEAMRHLKQRTCLLLASAFPFLCYFVPARMHLCSPDCMLGERRPITKWTKSLKHVKTSPVVEKLTQH